jgi:hypothetical protein
MGFLHSILVLVSSDHPELIAGVMLFLSKWHEFIFRQKSAVSSSNHS